MGIINNLGKWQNYTHYVLLAIGIYVWHSLPWNEVIEQMFITHMQHGLLHQIFYAFIPLILWWALGIFIFDTLIHFVFSILPEPFKWED